MMGDMTDDAERAEEFARGDEFYAGVDNQTTYEAGFLAGLAKLDQSWAEISALRPYDDSEGNAEFGYSNGLIDALEIIEKLGGMDPQKRAKE